MKAGGAPLRKFLDPPVLHVSVVYPPQAAWAYPPFGRLSNPLFILTFESHCTYSSVGVLDKVLDPVSNNKLLDSGSRARGGTDVHERVLSTRIVDLLPIVIVDCGRPRGL